MLKTSINSAELKQVKQMKLEPSLKIKTDLKGHHLLYVSVDGFDIKNCVYVTARNSEPRKFKTIDAVISLLKSLEITSYKMKIV